MIEAYVGLIGGGKTYSAQCKIMEYIASGGMVCTNIEQMLFPWYNQRYANKLKAFKVSPDREKIPVQYHKHLYWDGFFYWANGRGMIEYLRRRHQWDLQPGQLRPLDGDMIGGALHEYLPSGTAEKPVLVVIDEAVDWFDTDERSTANKDFLTFLRYSRKLCIDIIMIAQEFSELNKRIRNQVQWVWTFKDLGTERVPVLRMPYPPPYRYNIACAQWSARRYENLGEEPVRLLMRLKDQSIFSCYRTEELFRDVKVIRGLKTTFNKTLNEKGKVRKMTKCERFALVASIIISLIAFYKSGSSMVPTSEAIISIQENTGIIISEKENDVMTEPQEYLLAYVLTSDGGGRVTTDRATYHAGSRHHGREILRIVPDGYLYLDAGGVLQRYWFHSKPKTVEKVK